MAKILLSCHQFFPRYYTGTEILTLEMADELARRGHTVAILTTEPLLPGDNIPEKPEIKKDIFAGFHIWRLIIPYPHNPVERLERESNEGVLINLFNKVLDEWCPDIVHAFHLMRLTAAFVECVKQRGIPFYFTATDFWLICPIYQLVRYNGLLCAGQNPQACFSCLVDLYIKGMSSVPVHFRMARDHPYLAAFVNWNARKSQIILMRRIDQHRRLMAEIDGVFWPNNFLRDIFHKNGLRNNQEHLVPFPVPERSKRVFDLALPSMKGPLKIAFIGTLRPTKGPQVLLDACVKISNRRDLEVYIWGASDSPAFDADLRKRSAGIDWVHFCGTFPQEQFPDVLQDVHIVVISSLWYENTPLTALSALAAHRVLIASDLGGLSNLVEDGINGFLFPAGDTDTLAAILVRLAENRELVQKIASTALPPSRISDYTDAVLAVYDL